MMSDECDSLRILETARAVFWDFDGVIKDSVEVKTDAYVALFSRYGAIIAERIRRDHEDNGGVSRFKKIPLYMEWCGIDRSADKIDALCGEFATYVVDAVVNSAWVPGVKEYLRQNCRRQYFVLLTATPQQEIEKILDKLGIANCFRECYGAPAEKSATIRAVLQQQRIAPATALMIGDSRTDWIAAKENGIGFILRRTAQNSGLQSPTQPSFSDLVGNG